MNKQKQTLDPAKNLGTVIVDDLTIETDQAFLELTQDDDQIVLDKDQALTLGHTITVWLGDETDTPTEPTTLELSGRIYDFGRHPLPELLCDIAEEIQERLSLNDAGDADDEAERGAEIAGYLRKIAEAIPK